jgi:hypothetical protein
MYKQVDRLRIGRLSKHPKFTQASVSYDIVNEYPTNKSLAIMDRSSIQATAM